MFFSQFFFDYSNRLLVWKKNPKFETKIITNFAGSIGLPCIIFYSLTISNIEFDTFFKIFKIYNFIRSYFLDNWNNNY